jgi:NAD+ synthase (glutamine-hydrolysing)
VLFLGVVCVSAVLVSQLHLADDGNYREPRWFTSWPASRLDLEDLDLPEMIVSVTGQTTVPFGCGVIAADDGTVASETCEELFTPRSPHIALFLDGVDIIGNGSGSHHELRKLHKRIDLIRSATSKGGGVYMYSNQQGCDGGRMYYDGCALIAANGSVVAQGSQFGVSEVEVVTAIVDLDASRSYRMSIASRSVQAREQPRAPRVRTPRGFRLCRLAPGRVSATPALDTSGADGGRRRVLATPVEGSASSVADAARAGAVPLPDLMYGHKGAGGVTFLSPAEEIARGPACWLWDFLRTSRARGFFLPLSGGADSSATAAIVGVMCHMVCDAIRAGDEGVAADVRRVTGKEEDVDEHGRPWVPKDAKELCGLIMHTSYMGSENSSATTARRARELSDALGTFHMPLLIDTVVAAIVTLLTALFGGLAPRFEAHGGSWSEDIALQNIQARVRMVLSYALAQLLPWFRRLAGGRGGFLLVLGSANVDEALRGYMTKYDCSSADINPIGGVSKTDLKAFLHWAASSDGYGWTVLEEIAGAPPTAELRPMADKASADHSQTDEADMGMTYEELRLFGRLRKIDRCGPLSMCRRLLCEWTHLSATEVGEKVKRFWRYHTINRHKMTVLTPSYHAEGYSPDDNRFDLRPFLYRSLASQERAIDDWVRAVEGKS